MRAAAERAGRPGRALRLDDRSRRYRRCVRPGVGDVHRRRSVQAPVGPGRRPVRREAAHRGDAGADRAAASSRASRTWVPRASRAPPPRPPTAAGRASPSTSTRSRGASPAWSRSRCMISESQERMLAIVRPERCADVRAVCDRWGLPVRGHRPCHRRRGLTSSRAASSRRRCRRSELARIPARALASEADRPRRESPAARPPARGSRARARPSEPVDDAAGAGHGSGRRAPGAARRRRTWAQRAVGSRAVRPARRRRTRSPVRVAARPSSASRARPRRWSRRRTRTQRSARSIRGCGAARSVAEAARNVVDHGRDGRWASRTASTSGIRRAPRRSGSSRRRFAASATPAVRSTCPSPAATSSLYNEAPRLAPSRPRPRSASSGCWRTSRSCVGPAFSADGDAVLLVGDGDARARRARVRAHRGHGRRGRPPAIDLQREAAAAAVHPRGDRPRARRVGPGRLAAAASRWRSPRCAHLGRQRGTIRAAGGRLACGRAVRRRPVAGRRAASAAARPALHPRSPASTACPCDELGVTGGERLTIRLAGDGRDGCRRGARRAASPMRSTCRVDELRHAWEHGLPRALGDEDAVDGPEGVR